MSILEKPWEIVFVMGTRLSKSTMLWEVLGCVIQLSNTDNIKRGIFVLQKLQLCLHILSKCKSLSADLCNNLLTRVAGDEEWLSWE